MATTAFGVFVVDENDSQRTAIARFLRDSGFDVREASTGGQALEAAHGQPEVIVLAGQLADMDGAELCRRLKADPATAGIPLIQLTSDADSTPGRGQSFADDSIPASCSPGELAARVNLWARLAHAESELKCKTVELDRTRQELQSQLRDRHVNVAERERAEEALSAERDFSAAVLETVATLIVVIDAQGRITRFNRACREISGYTAAEVFGRPFWDFVAPESTENVQAVWDAMWAGATSFHHENYWIMKDGSRRLISWSNSCLMAADGSIEYIIATGIDVTERRKAEEALRRRERELQSILDSAPAGVVMADASGRILRASAATQRILGSPVTGDAHAPLGGYELCTLDGIPVPRGELPLTRALAGNSVSDTELLIRREDGSEAILLASATPLHNERGELAAAVAVFKDITAYKKVEQALRQSEALFRAAVENIPQMVFVANLATSFRYISPKWLKYTGTTEDENAGAGWAKAIHPDDRAQALQRWHTAVATLGVYETEYRLRRCDGEYRWHAVRALPIESGGEGPLWFGAIADIHDQKLTQELLVRSEKVAALGRMAATLAHDINNPLAAAMNSLYLARSDEELPELVKQYLETTDTQLKRIAHISRQALGFYRENSKPSPVALEAIADEAAALFKSKTKSKRIRLDKQYENERDVMAISGEVRQVLCNLIANSVDAVPEKGVIKLRVRSGVHPATSAQCVRVTVADNGAGIAPGAMPHLFEPLFTTKGSVGTGLGLWVSRQLIEKHGGGIRVRSSVSGPRRGTTFSILFPAHPAARASHASTANQ